MTSRHLLIFFPVLLVICTQSSSPASAADFPLSVRQIAIGYMANLHRPDPVLLFSNPSALYFINNYSAASIYIQPYEMKELNRVSAGFAKKIKKTTLGLGFSQFGFELYREQKIGLGLAIPLTNAFQLGVAFCYQGITIKNYGQSGSISINTGWVIQITERSRITGSLKNITRAKIGSEPLPQIMEMGLQLQPVKPLFIFAEWYKDLSFEPESRFGIEVNVLKNLYICAGFTRNPARFTGGIGLNLFNFSVDYGFSQHQFLGYTHSLGLVFSK